ncbi:MAG: DUF5710 domain-containing protein [Acidovorax sp.]|uniref:DUF5710 domain-containing protein n=1 Tax=Acidovorax sp. TaxID=1872122 RepID=UPI00391A7128
MRINLITPFAEKDAAKALGARWDSARKLWYVVDPQDLTPFMRWIPDMDAATEDAAVGAKGTAGATAASLAQVVPKEKASVVTGPAGEIAHCGCDVLPWIDCAHTATQVPR